MVRERRNSLASFRTLVFAWGLQSSACGPCVAVSRVGAVLLHRCHNPGRAGTGYCFLLCQSGFELFASENTRAALDGASRTHVAGDEPISLLLQPACHSGAHADCADAGSLEPGSAPPGHATQGVGLGMDRLAFDADDAHQNDRCFSPSRAWLSDGAAALADRQRSLRGRPAWSHSLARKTRRALRNGRSGHLCHHLLPLDDVGGQPWPATRLQIPFLYQQVHQACAFLLAGIELLVVIPRRTLG